MLTITIPGGELYDETNNEFIYVDEETITLEHSLVSLSKWESKWCKPYLKEELKSTEEIIDYIRCMTLTENVNPLIYNFITDENLEQITEYIEAPMTATTFSNIVGSNNHEIVTAELIYYWMVTFRIPFECENWHLNKLITFIRVCSIKNTPQKKMSQNEIMSQNRAVNEARKKAMNTKG